MNKLTEAEAKDILRHKKEKIKDIRTKFLGLYQELDREFNPDILSAAAVSSPSLAGLPGPTGTHKDLWDILEKYSHMRRERITAIRNMLCQLMEAESRINRVWACFYALGNPYFAILKALYVDNQLYQAVEREYEVSHKTFEKYRSGGIQMLIQYYESDVSDAELMYWSTVNKELKEPNAKRKKSDAQISIERYLSPPAREEGTEEAEKETEET